MNGFPAEKRHGKSVKFTAKIAEKTRKKEEKQSKGNTLEEFAVFVDIKPKTEGKQRVKIRLKTA